MRKCSLDKINVIFEEIAKSAKLYIPTLDKDGSTAYKKWVKDMPWSDALNTVKSPKNFFFPQLEDVVKFKTEGKNIEIIDARTEVEDFVVFGVRGCDVKSFEILDRVFLSDPVDSFYQAKREKGIIVSTACSKPAETCFCKTFGINPEQPEGDVTTWRTDTEIFFKANTPKGNILLEKIKDFTEECDDTAVEEQKEKINKIMNKLPLKDLTTDAFGGGKTEELFNHPCWEEFSQSCLGCGTCTFVCPTCQCYDIKDFNTGNGVVRYRCWDSCMYSDFTKMAHGNNRLSQKERFRQRFMHKLVYYPENNDGLFSCVGCGRCLVKCPISMNIVKVMKKIGGTKSE